MEPGKKDDPRCPLCDGPVIRSFQQGAWREQWCENCRAYTRELSDTEGDATC